jgi:hypothetical protein
LELLQVQLLAYSAAKQNGLELVDLRLSQLAPADLRGFSLKA